MSFLRGETREEETERSEECAAKEEICRDREDKLNRVGRELVVVDEDDVVRGAGRPDEAAVGLEVEVVGKDVGDSLVDDETGLRKAGRE